MTSHRRGPLGSAESDNHGQALTDLKPTPLPHLLFTAARLSMREWRQSLRSLREVLRFHDQNNTTEEK